MTERAPKPRYRVVGAAHFRPSGSEGGITEQSRLQQSSIRISYNVNCHLTCQISHSILAVWLYYEYPNYDRGFSNGTGLQAP